MSFLHFRCCQCFAAASLLHFLSLFQMLFRIFYVVVIVVVVIVVVAVVIVPFL